jgi:error-prone DNA polymerase
MSAYAELQCATNFSFLRGASHAEELITQAKHLGISALAVTDRNTLAGVVRAHAAAKDMELQMIVGSRLDIQPSPLAGEGASLLRGGRGFELLAYPTNRAAYGKLCRLLSLGQRRAVKGQCILTLDDVYDHAEGMIFALLPQSVAHLPILRKNLRAPLYLAVNRLYAGDDNAHINQLAEFAHINKTPLLATNDVLYHHPNRRVLQDVVTAIREGVQVAKAGYLLQGNAERHLKTPEEMARIFASHPQAISNTMEIAKACTFSLDELKYEYPEDPLPPGKTPQTHLADLSWQGAAWRYPEGVPAKVKANITKELVMIEKLNYAQYFLTVYDIVKFARGRPDPILCQGRGSAANSTVCYVIGITAVDPNQIDLLFERFISEERKEPPDIDVDFEHERREEVIQYLYARYGREHAGLAGTVITYRGRSAVREVGKVMGLSEDVTAALAGIVWGAMREEMHNGRLKDAGLDPDDPLLARVIELADEIGGFPRHLSQHVGGFILTRERLDETVPIGNGAMDDRTFIEWDKDDIDTLGILKIDVLALGMLTCIRKSFDLIEQWYGTRYSLATVPREDKGVYDMLCRADSVGVFQVESRAQMNMLPRLKPRCFYDLVIQVAIVRPGPIQGDMVHPYLRRRDGLEPEEYPSPHPEFGPADELRQVLGRTKGVPLFQEQAMKLAMVAAEFSAGEMNELRKAMATFRRRGTIGRLEQKMVSRMVERGYKTEFAQRCFNQIKGFGEYGFPESHAASFAHLVYVSSWLKCYYPDVFAAALLNSQPMGFYAPAQIVRDAKEHGVKVLPPDVNYSDWDSTLENAAPSPASQVRGFLPRKGGGLSLRLGLREITGLKRDAINPPPSRGRVTAQLSGEGAAASSISALEKLASADAFRSQGLDRRQALWNIKALTQSKPLPLFDFAQVRDQGVEEDVKLPEMPLSEHVVNDYQTIKLSLKGHPLHFLRERCAAQKVTDNEKLKTIRNNVAVSVAGVVLVRQRPGSAKGVVFLTLEDEFSVCNVVIWPQVLEQYRATVMGARLMLIKGRVQKSGDIIHVVATHIEDKTQWLQLLTEDGGKIAQSPSARHPRQVRVIPNSRNFH